MASQIDPTMPRDGAPASKADLRRNLGAAKRELEHGGFYLPTTQGAVARTVDAKLGDQFLSVKDFGALGDGSGATLAEWLAGGSRDRGYADLAAIQADYPEAKTLEATIDSIAILRAINQALAEGNDLVIPRGTYVVDPGAQRLEVVLTGGGQISILGVGRNSVIKRKEGSTTSNFTRLIEVTTGEGGFDYLEVRDLTIDSNARGNPIPRGESEWLFEHCADIFVLTTTTDPLGCARFANLYCLDAMADHISIGNEEGRGTTVGCAIFDQIVARGRTRPRADIIVYNGCELTLMSNLDIQRIETEFNRAPAQNLHISATNVRTEVLDLAGWGEGDHDLYFNGSNLNVTRQLMLYGLTATISGSRLKLRRDGRIINARDIHFVDTILLLPYDQQEREVTPLSFQYGDLSAARLYFVRCRFQVDAGAEVRTIAGYAVGPGNAVPASDRVLPQISFEQCEFDSRLDGCINAYRAGVWRSKECRFACRGSAVRVGTSDGYLQHYHSDNDNFTGVAGPIFLLGAGERGTENCRLTLCHALMQMPAEAFAVDTNWWDRIVLNSNRLLLIDEGPPSGGGFVGDRARLRRPIPGTGFEWLCTASHPTTASWMEVARLDD